MFRFSMPLRFFDAAYLLMLIACRCAATLMLLRRAALLLLPLFSAATHVTALRNVTLRQFFFHFRFSRRCRPLLHYALMITADFDFLIATLERSITPPIFIIFAYDITLCRSFDVDAAFSPLMFAAAALVIVALICLMPLSAARRAAALRPLMRAADDDAAMRRADATSK